jgi:hypothetical protein
VSHVKTILWGLIQSLIVILICGIALVASSQMQKWEAPVDGFVDDLAMLLIFGVAALISGTVVLTYPAYLILHQQIKEGFMLLIATIAWLLLLLGCLLIVIVFLDIHTIF